MPVTLRPCRRFPVQYTATYHAGRIRLLNIDCPGHGQADAKQARLLAAPVNEVFSSSAHYHPLRLTPLARPVLSRFLLFFLARFFLVKVRLMQVPEQ